MRLFSLILTCLTLSLYLLNPLNAEIQEVKVTWAAGLCTADCARLVAQELSKVQGVTDVEMNVGAGEAKLKWAPNAPFAYRPLDYAIRMIGPRIHNVRVKVKGKVVAAAGSIKLVSDGDQTEFYLLGPADQNPGQTMIQSVYNRPLTPNSQEKLLDAKQQNLSIVVEGPLFQAQRSPPNQLVAENISVEEVKPQ